MVREAEMLELSEKGPAPSARVRFLIALCACALVLGCKAEEPGNDTQAGTGGFAGVMPAGPAGAGGMIGAGVGGMAGGLAGMAGSLAGAGASGMGAQMSYAPTFSAIFSEILTRGSTGNCMFGACHGGDPDPELNGNLQIRFDDKQGAYDHLVNVVSTSPLCAGMTLVVPGNADGSMLIQKLGPTPPCGTRMPIGLPLNDMHMNQIATWINNGAMND
jgi:hypothetical protein